jgi:Dolichyl-phosphate-mannose-protein mannosyltransferase
MNCRPNDRCHPLLPLIVLLLAFGLRISAATYWDRSALKEGQLFRLGDSHSYWTLAGEIAHGRPYQYGSENAKIFRAPIYPLALSQFTLIQNERDAVWSARVLGCCLGTLCVGLVMILAKSLGDWRSMVAAGLLAAVYPGAIGMSIVILSEAVFCPLMLGHLALWQAAWQCTTSKKTIALGVIAGCLAGLGILTRPSWLLFAPTVALIGFVIGPRRWHHVTIFLATGLGIVLVMSPWWVRNASVTGQFVLTTLQVGPSLYDGLHEGATGASDEGMDFMQQFVAEQQAEDAIALNPKSTFEYRLNQRAHQAAVDWVVNHPQDAIKLAFKKFIRTWNLWPNGGEVGSSILRAGLTIGCFSVLSFALIGSLRMWLSDRRLSGYARTLRARWELYWIPCIYFTLLHMVFVGSIRYREPALLVLTIVAGQAFFKLRNQER